MLHWLLRPVLPKNNFHQLFFVRIFTICTLVHLVLLGFLFLYKWQKNVVHISRHELPSQAAIIYVPWVKRFNQFHVPGGIANSGTKQQKNVENKFSGSKVQAQPKSKAGFVDTKIESRTKKIFKAKAKLNKQKKQSTLLSKHEKDKNLKKEKKNKSNNVIKDEPQSPPIEKQKLLPLASVPIAQNQESIENIVENKSQENHDLPILPNNQISEFSSELLNQPIYIGRDEKDEYEFMANLQEEIKSEWKPPLGFMWSKPCIVQVSVDSDGKVQKVDIKQSSGILVVDIGIRTALERIRFSSNYVQGKELTLSFDC